MFFFRFFKRLFFGRRLDTRTSRIFLGNLEKIEKLSDMEKIIRYDALYHKILQALGYKGSFGEILKRNPKEIKNIQEIWKLHKLRNTLVHELEQQDSMYLYSQSILYKKTLEFFLHDITR